MSVEMTRRNSEQYEFTHEQEQIVSQLSNSLRWLAAPMISLGALILIYLLMHAIMVIREGFGENLQLVVLPLFLLGLSILFFTIGNWCSRAGRAFHEIVRTQGDDVHQLICGLIHLNQVFRIISIFVKAMILLTFLGLSFNLLWAFTNPKLPAKAPTLAVER